MFDYTDSPPPLHHSPATSDKSRFPSRDSTPVTPVGFGPPTGKKADKDQCLPWFKKPIDVGKATTSLCLDTTLLEPDFDDHSFPLFGSSPPGRSSMAGAAAPINISARQTSTSPRGNQASNLTSALQRTDSDEKRARDAGDGDRASGAHSHRKPSAGEGLSHLEHGGRPINGAASDKYRRESIAQSLNTGMSWGGISVGSWIRDDVMMSGTSPFTFHQSPSYHSSSYLPKLEANFMRDFSCCGLTLPSLHDLLQHYEEAHADAQKSSQNSAAPEEQAMPDSRAAIATNTAASVQQEAQRQQQQYGNFKPIAPAQSAQQAPTSHAPPLRPAAFSSTLQTIPDMDTVEDMEMDDVEEMDEKTPPPNLYTKAATHQSPHAQFSAVAQPRLPQLNMNMMQSQALRSSNPPTPTTQGRAGASMYNNPSASAINTPTLTGNPMQQQFQNIHDQQYHATPDSSAPGTPAELDDNIVEGMDDMSMQNSSFYMNQTQNFNYGAFGTTSDMLDLCIDEPAKRLFSTTGGFTSQSQAQAQGHMRLGSGQYGPNSDLARRIREQQMLAGLPDTTTGLMPHDEPKPFRCPVIGCEKAYKNQNGLKYHKSHGHNNQQLHDNADGTFSIVNPETSAPYPGTMGMEKEKPYKCEVCGKRYKNLNGLKYHKSHSPPCNPELQLNLGRASAAGIPGLTPNQTLGGAFGAGLPTEAGMV